MTLSLTLYLQACGGVCLSAQGSSQEKEKLKKKKKARSLLIGLLACQEGKFLESRE